MSAKMNVFNNDDPRGVRFIRIPQFLQLTLDKYTAKLLLTLYSTGKETVNFPTSPILLNEPTVITVYQVFDSFLQKYVTRLRVNGTVISKTELNISPPDEYQNVQISTTDAAGDLISLISLSNLYLLELP